MCEVLYHYWSNSERFHGSVGLIMRDCIATLVQGKNFCGGGLVLRNIGLMSIDNIAVSVFVVILVEFDKFSSASIL